MAIATGRRHAESTRVAADPDGVPPIVPLSDLLTAVRREISEGWTPSDAARIVLGRMAPDTDAVLRLLEVGLAQLANTELGVQRRGAGRPAIVGRIAAEAVDPLTVPAEGVDGTMKPWLVWSIGDWRSWERYCETQADGWARRQDGSREIAGLLEKRSAERVADLKPADQEKVRQIIKGFRA